MSFSVRALSVVALVGTAFTALAQARPPWATRWNLDWWNVPVLCEQIQRGERDLAALQPTGEILVARAKAKAAVTEDLLAGRLTLLQTAAQFRKLNAEQPASKIDLRQHFAGATEEERLCRQVIQWAAFAARDISASASEQTRSRLEAELAGLLAARGRVVLPD